MTVKYDISLDDLIAFQSDFLGNDRKLGSVLKYTLLVFALIISVLVGSKFIASGEFSIADFIFLCLMALLLLLFRKLHNKTTMRFARKIYDQPGNATLLGEKTLTLSDRGLEISDRNKSAKYSWDGVVKASETVEHFFIYDSAISALIIPRKQLTADQNEQVKAILKKYRMLP
ncbi:MAG: YcxB family protein [Rikenellaceae bacterium]|nr:YcxB family protein [Rikenellaceae bacterium]